MAEERPRRLRKVLWISLGAVATILVLAVGTVLYLRARDSTTAVSVDEAIAVNTINGAYASREESLKGSITAGKLADFVLLADDPHTVSPSKIKDIQIVRTVVGGGTVYEA